MVQQPTLAGGEVGVIVEGRRQPVRRPLHDQHRLGLLGDHRNELRGTGTGADHGYPLAGEIDVVVPLGRVEGRPGERGASFDVGEVRAIQLAGGVDDGVELLRL